MINYELKIRREQKVSLSLSLSFNLYFWRNGIPRVPIVFFPSFSHSTVSCPPTGPYIKMIYCYGPVTRPSIVVIIIFIETFARCTQQTAVRGDTSQHYEVNISNRCINSTSNNVVAAAAATTRRVRVHVQL